MAFGSRKIYMGVVGERVFNYYENDVFLLLDINTEKINNFNTNEIDCYRNHDCTVVRRIK